MDLTLNNEISKNKTVDSEVNSFMEELENSLTKEENLTPTLTKEFLKEIDLAEKYEDKLDSIINKYMKELSYDYEYLYFDYDKQTKSYYFDYCSDGEIEREYISKKEAKGLENKKGTFFKIWDEDNILESEGLKDNIKFNTEIDLEDLEEVNLERKFNNNEE